MLIADIGNTACKILVATDESVTRFYLNLKNSIDIDKLAEILKENEGENIYVSSVNSKYLSILESHALKNNMKINLMTREVMERYSSQVKYKIDNLDVLASDLFADIVGCDKKEYRMIVDCGTATKILVVDDNDVFLGGSIFPGIASCSSILNNSTDLLDKYETEVPPNLYSLNTKDAINAGSTYGTAMIVIGYAERLANHNVKIILTGGASSTLVKALDKLNFTNYTHDLDHLFKGIARTFGIYDLIGRHL